MCLHGTALFSHTRTKTNLHTAAELSLPPLHGPGRLSRRPHTPTARRGSAHPQRTTEARSSAPPDRPHTGHGRARRARTVSSHACAARPGRMRSELLTSRRTGEMLVLPAEWGLSPARRGPSGRWWRPPAAVRPRRRLPLPPVPPPRPLPPPRRAARCCSGSRCTTGRPPRARCGSASPSSSPTSCSATCTSWWARAARAAAAEPGERLRGPASSASPPTASCWRPAAPSSTRCLTEAWPPLRPRSSCPTWNPPPSWRCSGQTWGWGAARGWGRPSALLGLGRGCRASCPRSGRSRGKGAASCWRPAGCSWSLRCLPQEKRPRSRTAARWSALVSRRAFWWCVFRKVMGFSGSVLSVATARPSNSSGKELKLLYWAFHFVW